MSQIVYKMVRTEGRLSTELGRDATEAEIAEEMGLAIERVEHARRSARSLLSLDMTVGEEDDTRLQDFIPDRDALEPMEAAAAVMLRDLVDDALATLSARERRVLQLRFGLIDGSQWTLEDVGKRLGVTRERIRQIESQAIRKLRQPARSRDLREFDST